MTRSEEIRAWIVGVVSDTRGIPSEDLVELLMRTWRVGRATALLHVRRATSYPNPPTCPPDVVARSGYLIPYARRADFAINDARPTNDSTAPFRGPEGVTHAA